MVDLFSNPKIKDISFKNRIAMPPMVIGWIAKLLEDAG